jgi:hypothetical protein
MEVYMIRKIQIGLGLAALLVMAGSVAAQKVEKDYDHHANFERYHTYMWIHPPDMKNPLMAQRTEDAINAQLQAKGWQLVTENADVGIAVHGATQERHDLESFYSGWDGWGRWGWHRWGGPPVVTTTVNTYTVGTLLVDMFDSQTKQLIFRGTATDTLSEKPEKNEHKLNEAIEKMFDHFPPK